MVPLVTSLGFLGKLFSLYFFMIIVAFFLDYLEYNPNHSFNMYTFTHVCTDRTLMFVENYALALSILVKFVSFS